MALEKWKNLLPRFPSHADCSLVTIPTKISQLPIPLSVICNAEYIFCELNTLKTNVYLYFFFFFFYLVRKEVNSSLRCEVDVNCILLGYFTTSSCNFLPMLQANLSVPSSKVKTGRIAVLHVKSIFTHTKK